MSDLDGNPEDLVSRVAAHYRDQPWFSVFKHSMDHEGGV